MNDAQDIRVTLRAKGYFRQPDGSYSKVAPGLARPCGELQKQEALRAERVCLHGPESEGANEVHHRRVPRTVKLSFYISDRRRRDIDGMTSTVLDCLVRAGAIPDDNRFEVGRLEAEAVDCPPGQERVEVEIVGQLDDSERAGRGASKSASLSATNEPPVNLRTLDYCVSPSYGQSRMPSEPVCPNILFCDLVITEQGTGKHSFVGCFPGLASPQFPMVVPRFFVAATLGNVGTEQTLHVTVNIRVPSTGAVVASTTAQLQRAPNAPVPPYGVDLFDLYLPFMNVMFPTPGLYEAVVLLGGDEVGKRPFPIAQVSMQNLIN